MPITRKTRKKTGHKSDENNKENIVENRITVRESKVEAVKKIKENVEDSFSFISTDEKLPDTFDLLYSSPMKQEVNFKPLSFWSKKVKELESKENIKKKKCGLYELSETDDSNSSQANSQKGKKPKRKRRPTVGRQKNKRTGFDFNAKNFMKKSSIESKDKNKEGSIIRERITLQKLNDKFTDKDGKFCFKNIATFGLTSTPGKSEKLNLVGGSTFDFLSPIPIPEDNQKIANYFHTDTEGETCESKVRFREKEKEDIGTPKWVRKTRGNGKVITNIGKQVSGTGHSKGNYLQNSFTAFGSFTEKPKLGEFFRNNNTKSGNAEAEIKTFTLNSNDKVLYPGSFAECDDELNTSFLYLTKDELNEEMNTETFLEEEYQDDCSNINSKMHEQVVKTPCALKVQTNSDSDKMMIDLSFCEFRSFPERPLLSTSLLVGESQLNLGCPEQCPLVQDIKIGSVCSKTSTVVSPEFRKKNFSKVLLRGHCNGFYNFRRSAKSGSFELPHGVNSLNQSGSFSELVNDGALSIPLSLTKGFNCLNNTVSKNCFVGTSVSEQWERLLMNHIGNEGHRTQRKPTVEVINNIKMGSNQYRSKEKSVSSIGEHLQFYSDSGNDSSVFISSPETQSTVRSPNYSVCRNAGNKERKESPDDSVPGTRIGSESSPGDCRDNDVTCVRLASIPKLYGSDKKRGQTSGMRVESLIHGSSPLRSAPVELTISDVTLSEEFDFPPPIFESTICPTPARGRGTKKNVIDEKTKLEAPILETEETCINSGELELSVIRSFQFEPRKKWARYKSLNGTLQLNHTAMKGIMHQTFVDEALNRQTDAQNQTAIVSSGSHFAVTAVTNKMSHLALKRRTVGNRTVKIVEEGSEDEEMDCSFRSLFRNLVPEKRKSTFLNGVEDHVVTSGVTLREKPLMSARDHVLMRCNQEAPLPFEEYFNERTLKNCKKIGEGTFGEVFICNSNRVIKIMPIEGLDEVNGEQQKKFDEILSEMVIAMELSNLRNNDKHRTSGFCELKRSWCVQGKYPSYLIDLWNDFDCVGHGSQNDSPVMFKSDQLYIILEFGNGGKDLEAFVFTTGGQALSILFQVAYSLAVAEKVLEFEHRDLHWGNILIAPTREKYFKVVLNSEEIKIPTKGVKVTIIDFTLSRIIYNGCSIYNDLSSDPTLFTSEGDLQFEVYRLMKRELANDWSLFRPKTNLFWLDYVVDKMVKMVHYKKTVTKSHTVNLAKLDQIKSNILNFSDSEEFVMNYDLIDWLS